MDRTWSLVLPWALLLAVGATAGTNTWTRIGPPGACVNDLAAMPGTPEVVYAATPAGVWKSTDGGATWAATGSELRATEVWRVAVAGTAGDVVLAAVLFSGLWRSTDGGASWSLAVAAPPNSWGYASVAVAPSDPQVVYYLDEGGCYRSTDAGATWLRTRSVSRWVNNVAVKPDDPDTFLAALEWELCVSRDGGTTLSCQAMRGWVSDVAFDPGTPSTALASASSDGVWRTTDAGQTWVRSDPAPGEAGVWSVAFAQDGSGVAWAGARGGRLYRSTDGGASWSAVATGSAVGVGRALRASAGTGGTVLFGAAPGLLRSTDQGSTWAPAVTGLEAPGTRSLAFSGTTAPRLYVGTEGAGVYSTTDGGTTWNGGTASGPFETGFARYLGGSADSPDRAVAGLGAEVSAPLDIAWTTDGGATWSVARAESPNVDYDWLSVAITSDPARLYGASGAQYLYRSTDAGTTWHVPVLGPTTLGVVPWSGTTVLAAGHNLNGRGAGIWISTDEGDHWRQLTWSAPMFATAVAIATPARPDITAAFTPNVLQVVPWITGDYRPRLYREVTVPATGELFGLAPDHTDANVVAVGSVGGGVLRSTDGRRTWRPLTAGLDDPRVHDLEVDPADPHRLAAATPSGVYVIDLVPPQVASLSPASLPAGSGDTVVDVSGSGFGTDAVVTVEGVEVTTSRSGADLLRATVPGNVLATPGIRSLAAVSAGVQSNTVPLVVRFLDVPPGHWAYRFVHLAAERGVAAGCGGGKFCPDAPVTRAQAAVLLLASLRGSGWTPPLPCRGVFADVPCPGHWAADWIEELYRLGITAGCGGGNFCPEEPVTRAQMAVLLLATRDGKDYVPPHCTGVFSDVPCPGHWAADWIEDLANQGITAGCGGGSYCPGEALTRAQMAVLLAATFGWTFPGL